jgi:hypothetical protein
MTDIMRKALSLIKELTAKVAEWEEECDLRGDMWCKLNEENKRLTEENERLSAYNENLIKTNTHLSNHLLDEVEQAKDLAISDTVRKMHSEIEKRCIKGGIYPAFVKSTIDQIAKEMVGEV